MAIISEIPTEVLPEIFYLLCKKPIFVCELNNSCCKEDFPWAVGLVCRQWRTAFLSYPPIWASLAFSDSYDDLFRISDPRTRSESNAKEINRRLALYLERSGGYPLRFDISISSGKNKAFTMMALEMLLACSHRWQTAKFDLEFWNDWPWDSILACKGKLPILEQLEISGTVSPKDARDIFEVAPRLTHAHIGPWGKHYGCILPWTQLTQLVLTVNDDSVIKNGHVTNFLLPMLHNITELRFHFYCDYLDFEDEFPQFAPTSQNQLRVLEVTYPTILSWFETPSLCELYFTGCQQDYGVLLDAHGEISSLIQRSSCKIRKLSFDLGRGFHVGTLEDVEELIIDYQRSYGDRPSIDISSLPNLRLLTIICSIDQDFESLRGLLTSALKSARVPTRGKCSPGSSISLLERVTVELPYDDVQPEIPPKLLKLADKWPLVVFRTRRRHL